MKHITTLLFSLMLVICYVVPQAQTIPDSSLLTIDRIFSSNEFRQQNQRPIRWIENGNAYLTIERSAKNADELIRWDCTNQKRSVYVAANLLKDNDKQIRIEQFTQSPDGSKVLIFTNSSRVWRSNTKGDYWVYNRTNKSLKKLGKKFKSSSLMFAKFSSDNKYVAYVHDFNLYKEDFNSGEITQLTFDGTGDIINGTFDWAYEEEFGKRDGFSWSPDAGHIAFWQVDATDIRTFYMINNTDSIYSRPIPLQYPKVGQDPSSAKIGLINLANNKIEWIALEGDEKQNYIPGIQWINRDLLLIQQLNRKQNTLKIWTYKLSTKRIKRVYTEVEDTWVDLKYPDITASHWGDNDLPIVDEGTAFLRLTETPGWRQVFKVNIHNSIALCITPGTYDVASMRTATKRKFYFIASPDNSTQRYLFATHISGRKRMERITPQHFPGINNYNISPNGKYAIHTHSSTSSVRTVRLITLPDHEIVKVLVGNKKYANKLATLALPNTSFTKVTTESGLDIDVRMTYPINFDPDKKYPVLFQVYGEPWGQQATDSPIGLWAIMLAQKGFVIIDMDNRGTPCLRGSAWRKSIYRNIGIINTKDQAEAAKEILKLDYLDNERVAVWGWSGGGTMTLNLLFKYPEIYQTGIAIASVSNQLVYDNIYQERYMGLPQENMEDFVNGSPITYAKNLEGNLLLIHGTADDNVHYQSAELLINELVKHKKMFDLMSYPGRSHGLREGVNTYPHLYTMMTNYLIEHSTRN